MGSIGNVLRAKLSKFSVSNVTLLSEKEEEETASAILSVICTDLLIVVVCGLSLVKFRIKFLHKSFIDLLSKLKNSSNTIIFILSK